MLRKEVVIDICNAYTEANSIIKKVWEKYKKCELEDALFDIYEHLQAAAYQIDYASNELSKIKEQYNDK